MTRPLASGPSCTLMGVDQHADHGAAEHLGHEIDFVRRAHDPDRVGRIGGDEDDVGD